MKCNRFKIFLFAACAMFAFGCGDSGNSGNTKEQRAENEPHEEDAHNMLPEKADDMAEVDIFFLFLISAVHLLASPVS